MPDDPDYQPGADDPLDSTQWAVQISASNGALPVQWSLPPFYEASDRACTGSLVTRLLLLLIPLMIITTLVALTALTVMTVLTTVKT